MSFNKEIQEWILLDNEIKSINKRLKNIRERKCILEESLFQTQASSNQSTIKLLDGYLNFTTTKITTPLTFKYIENTLGKIIKNNEQVSKIIYYLKTLRETKIVPEIKRIIDSGK
jgi:hypothetical protein